MDVSRRFADDPLCSHLFYQTGYLQTALEIRANADKADIKIGNAKALENSLIGTVSNLRAYYVGEHRLQPFFHLIHDHDLLSQPGQIVAEVMTKPAHSDD